MGQAREGAKNEFVVPLMLMAVFLFPSVARAQRPVPHNLQDPKLSPQQQAAEYYQMGQETVAKVDKLEAKGDYETLARRKNELASEVLESMTAWIATRRNDPAGIDSNVLDELEVWVESR